MPIDPSKERLLCRLEDIQDQKSKGFLRERREDKIFAVRQDGQVFVYLNSCPHNWVPMDFRQDHFLSGDGKEIVCYAHGAHFAIDSGRCVSGVCLGDYLVKVPARIEDGAVIIPNELPPIPRPAQTVPTEG